MSLLIKALASAEKDKQVELDKKKLIESDSVLPLELAPIDEAQNINKSKSPSKSFEEASIQNRVELKQKDAAKVFVANQAVSTPSSKLNLLLIGVAGAAVILLGFQGYSYIQSLSAPQMASTKLNVTAVQPIPIQQVEIEEASPQSQPELNMQVAAASTDDQEKANDETLADKQPQANSLSTDNDEVKKISQRQVKTSHLKTVKNSVDNNASSMEDSQPQVNSKPSKQAPLKLTTKSPAAGVDPTLLAAYEALNRGEYAIAQQQYRAVLQKDVRNVDALLGMAVIAQRQTRDADAEGWFQKVLEVEPRNVIAQTALMGVKEGGGGSDRLEQNSESHIKSMLAQQPEAANLHAALGNVYAEQGQWASAQSAYFEASKLAPHNADYAFNLAVSLEQMRKPHLALEQYQRALALLNQSGATSPDRLTLETRIQALQK
jgi:Tfp pilus assembly protein PilF